MAVQDILNSNQNLKTPAQKKPYEDDGSRYIFPAGETAPGASFSPATPVAPTPQDVNATLETPVMLAAQPPAPGEIESQYNIPNARTPAMGSTASIPSDPNYFMQAYNTETAAAKKMGEFEKDAFGRIAQQDQAALLESQELQKKQDAAMQKFDETYKTLSDDVNSKKVDSRRWWKEKSTGDRVMTMVGMALASVSPTSFQNAMQAIDKTIERDVNDQKADIENGRMKLTDAKTLYAENMRRFGDQRVALAATRMMNADVIKNQLNSQLAGVKGDLAKANGLKMLGQVEQYKSKQQVEIAKLLKDQGKENRELGISGFKGQAPDATSARNFREAVVATENIKTKIGQLKNLAKQSFTSISPKSRAEAEEAIGTIMAEYKTAKQLGTLDAGVERLMEKFIANPTDIFSTSTGSLKKLEEFEKSINTGVQRQAKILGLTPESASVTSFRPN